MSNSTNPSILYNYRSLIYPKLSETSIFFYLLCPLPYDRATLAESSSTSIKLSAFTNSWSYALLPVQETISMDKNITHAKFTFNLLK